MGNPRAKRRKLNEYNSGQDSPSSGESEVRADNPLKDSQHKFSRKRPQDTEFGEVYNNETFRSSIFKLQVDDLLDQVIHKHNSKDEFIERATKNLKEIIEQIPARGPLSISDAEQSLLASSKVIVPFPSSTYAPNANYKLEYRTPSYINAIGSYPLKVATRTDQGLSIDLIVTMPADMLQEKDFLNFRYIHKKSYYIACIAAGIKEAAGNNFILKFGLLNGNSLQPVLKVLLQDNRRDGDYTAFQNCVQIIPTIPEDVFPAQKLLLDKNCVRSTLINDVNVTANKPTPFYNSTTRADSLMISYSKLIYSASKQCESFRDACSLGRVWLRQRGLSSSISGGGFGNFEWHALLSILLQARGSNGLPSVSPGYSSYQLFKSVLRFLSDKDTPKQTLSLGCDNGEIRFMNAGPVFWDSHRQHNLLYKMTMWSYRFLKFEAASTIRAFSTNLFDPFDSTFIVRVDQPRLRYDYTLDLAISALAISQRRTAQEVVLPEIHNLYNVLYKGLGHRVEVINIILAGTNTWEISQEKPISLLSQKLTIGIVLNPSHSGRLIDQGPPAEDKNAVNLFRKFWGDKAELRRFKDGSILESVVWTSGDTPVVKQIIEYLLVKDFTPGVLQNISFSGIQIPGLPGFSQPDSGTSPYQRIMTAFSDLERDIRSLKGLPLAVRHIFGADPTLRYSSNIPPLVSGHGLMPKPANVVIQFEGSGRWPDDIEAIQRTKIAFLLKLADLLIESISGLSARLGVEKESSQLLNCSFLDIVYTSGAAFRVRVHHDREEILLQRRLSDKALSTTEREEARNALAIYKRDYISQPAHTQVLQTLCTRLPSLSPTIRLTKKWFDSHLLTGHIPEEVIELLVVQTFVQPYPWRVPSSALTGFLRTLHFLSRWDWRSQPLVVDLGGSMTAAELEGIRTRFEAWRKIDPLLNRVVLFAASNADPDGTTWTDHSRPAKVIAARMSALAKAAVKAIKTQTPSTTLFVSPLDDFDFVLQLDSRYAGEGMKQAEKQARLRFKNLQDQGTMTAHLSSVGKDPVGEFIDELRSLYGDAFLLFSSSDKTDVVAGVWNPMTDQRAWRVRSGFSSKPQPPIHGGTEGETTLNRHAVLAEIARLGGGLIHRIEEHPRRQGVSIDAK